MEIKGEQIVKKGKKMPQWIWIGYLVCIIVIIVAAFLINDKETNRLPEAIDFTTEGALGMKENQYAYLEVQGLTDEIAVYGNTDNWIYCMYSSYCCKYIFYK